MNAASLPLWKRLLFGGIAVVGAPIAVLVAIEGSASLLLLGRDLLRPVPVVTERGHTSYDTLLGWVARPEFYDRDLYGPGIYLRTNARGFRSDRETGDRVVPPRFRALCSGDSFTLGWGVDNEHTWCALLERAIPRLETVNMGQGGYGADQAYLWYRRDGSALDHQIQLFAVIAEDFQRMRRSDFLGFGKPRLRLEADTLRLENVPVPSWSYRVPRLASYLYWKRPFAAQLRVAELVQRLRERFAASRANAPVDGDSATWRIADRMLRDLVTANRAKGSALVVVFLPIQADRDGGAADRWRRRLAAAAPRDGYRFVDLVADFRRLAPDSAGLLFLDPRDRYSHYGNAGHRWAAERLYRHLLTFPEIAGLLTPARGADHGAPGAPGRPGTR